MVPWLVGSGRSGESPGGKWGFWAGGWCGRAFVRRVRPVWRGSGRSVKWSLSAWRRGAAGGRPRREGSPKALGLADTFWR